jgi:hypothetical protein
MIMVAPHKKFEMEMGCLAAYFFVIVSFPGVDAYFKRGKDFTPDGWQILARQDAPDSGVTDMNFTSHARNRTVFTPDKHSQRFTGCWRWLKLQKERVIRVIIHGLILKPMIDEYSVCFVRIQKFHAAHLAAGSNLNDFSNTGRCVRFPVSDSPYGRLL